MGKKFKGDLNQFTEAAIKTIQHETRSKGPIIESSAAKKLLIAVTNVHFEDCFSNVCVSNIVVESADGFKEKYEGHDRHSWIIQPAINGSLNHAIVNFLKGSGNI